MKKVKFLKYCPWSFSLTRKLGRPCVFNEGDIEEVDDIEAESMIANDYAMEVSEPDPEPEEDERYLFYKQRFSLSELKEFCKEKEISIKPSIHNTIPKIIKMILGYEEEVGLLIKDENE